MKDECDKLSIGFLQQGTPKLPWCCRTTEEQHSVFADWQPIVHHNIHPATKAPEPKVEDPGVQLRTLWVPLLIHMVRNDLE